jgi:hypothetical protein
MNSVFLAEPSRGLVDSLTARGNGFSHLPAADSLEVDETVQGKFLFSRTSPPRSGNRRSVTCVSGIECQGFSRLLKISGTLFGDKG